MNQQQQLQLQREKEAAAAAIAQQQQQQHRIQNSVTSLLVADNSQISIPLGRLMDRVVAVHSHKASLERARAEGTVANHLSYDRKRIHREHLASAPKEIEELEGLLEKERQDTNDWKIFVSGMRSSVNVFYAKISGSVRDYWELRRRNDDHHFGALSRIHLLLSAAQYEPISEEAYDLCIDSSFEVTIPLIPKWTGLDTNPFERWVNEKQLYEDDPPFFSRHVLIYTAGINQQPLVGFFFKEKLELLMADLWANVTAKAPERLKKWLPVPLTHEDVRRERKAAEEAAARQGAVEEGFLDPVFDPNSGGGGLIDFTVGMGGRKSSLGPLLVSGSTAPNSRRTSSEARPHGEEGPTKLSINSCSGSNESSNGPAADDSHMGISMLSFHTEGGDDKRGGGGRKGSGNQLRARGQSFRNNTNNTASGGSQQQHINMNRTVRFAKEGWSSEDDDDGADDDKAATTNTNDGGVMGTTARSDYSNLPTARTQAQNTADRNAVKDTMASFIKKATVVEDRNSTTNNTSFDSNAVGKPPPSAMKNISDSTSDLPLTARGGGGARAGAKVSPSLARSQLIRAPTATTLRDLKLANQTIDDATRSFLDGKGGKGAADGATNAGITSNTINENNQQQLQQPPSFEFMTKRQLTRYPLEQFLRDNGMWKALFKGAMLKEMVYSSVIVIYRPTPTAGQEASSSALRVREYTNVPVGDVEALLPDKEVQLPPMDSVYTFVQVVLLVVFLVLGLFDFYEQATADDNPNDTSTDTSDTSRMMMALVLVAGLASRLYTLLITYNRTKERYGHEVEEWMEKKREGKDDAVISKLASNVCSQECKEILLTYYFLWQMGPMTAIEVQRKIHTFLREEYHVKNFCFDIVDALTKLQSLGLITVKEDEQGKVNTNNPANFANNNTNGNTNGNNNGRNPETDTASNTDASTALTYNSRASNKDTVFMIVHTPAEWAKLHPLQHLDTISLRADPAVEEAKREAMLVAKNAGVAVQQPAGGGKQ